MKHFPTHRPVAGIGNFLRLLLLSLFTASALFAEAKVGEWLYADPAQLPEEAKGILVLQLDTPFGGKAILWGTKYRKDQISRFGTDTTWRERVKPRLGKVSSDGKTIEFEKLLPDFYDILLLYPDTMQLEHGLTLVPEAEKPEEATREQYEDISKFLTGKRTDGSQISAWESFFDGKEVVLAYLIPYTTPQEVMVFLQQVRKGEALAESGAVLPGHVHSLDVIWLRQASHQAGWQILERQQLYRAQLPSKEFFQCSFRKELSRIRITSRPKKLLFTPLLADELSLIQSAR